MATTRCRHARSATTPAWRPECCAGQAHWTDRAHRGQLRGRVRQPGPREARPANPRLMRLRTHSRTGDGGLATGDPCGPATRAIGMEPMRWSAAPDSRRPHGGCIRPQRSSTMTQSSKKPALASLGTALAGGLLLSGSSFAITPLAQGYMVGAQEAATKSATANEHHAHGDKAKTEGKCGEGKCGLDKVDTDKDVKVSRAEFEAVHPAEGAK